MRSPVTPEDFDAVLFDLDGVLTTTATLHESAWRSTFDTFLDEWDAAHGTSTARFEVADCAAYVDGKPRQDGVRDFLAARGDLVTYTVRSGEPVTARHRGHGIHRGGWQAGRVPRRLPHPRRHPRRRRRRELTMRLSGRAACEAA
jgi:hypothetical protein